MMEDQIIISQTGKKILIVRAKYAQPELMSYMEIVWDRLKETFLDFSPIYQEFRTQNNKELVELTDPIIDERKKNFPNHNQRELIHKVEEFFMERNLGLQVFIDHCKKYQSEEVVQFFSRRVVSTYLNLVRNIALSRSYHSWKLQTLEINTFVANRHLVQVDFENSCIRYTFDGQEYQDDIIIEHLEELKPLIDQYTIKEIKIDNFKTIRLKIQLDSEEEQSEE